MDDARPHKLAAWKLLMDACARDSGVLTTKRAAGLGLDTCRLSRLVTAGVLVRESRGVYRLSAYPLGFDQRLTIATRSGGVVSHETAAMVWGCDLAGDSVIHVSVRHGFLPTTPSWVAVHETRRTLTGWTTTRCGVTLTTPLRTVLDLAGRSHSGDPLRRFVNHGIAIRLFSISTLERFAADHGGKARGIARLRRLINELSDVGSVAEADLLALLAAAGIERPVSQFVIRHGARFVARVDAGWPTQRVALELDGYRYHADARTFVDDRERGNRIVAAGWTLLRTTPTTVRDRPHTVVADVKAALNTPNTVSSSLRTLGADTWLARSVTCAARS
jgi:hypothetical protein